MGQGVFAGLVLSTVLLLGVAVTSDGILSRPLPRPVWCLLLYRLMGAHGFSYDVSNGGDDKRWSQHEPLGRMSSTKTMRPF